MDISNFVLSNNALKLVNDGTWIGDLSGAPGVELMVIGLKSDDARSLMSQKEQAIRLKNKGKELTANQTDRIIREVLAEVVLKDWKGLKQDGKDLPYSPELAQQFLVGKGGDAFVSLVIEAANTLDSYANDLADNVKKS